MKPRHYILLIYFLIYAAVRGHNYYLHVNEIDDRIEFQITVIEGNLKYIKSFFDS